MQVLITVGLIAIAAIWVMALMRRLTEMRAQITLAWKKLESDPSNEAIKTVYNKHVNTYNDALDAFPTNIVAMFGGFKPARNF